VSLYVGVPLIIVAALSEAAVLPLFRISGLQPNLVLTLLVAWLMVRGSGEAFVLIAIGGGVLGLVDGAPLGTALLALAPLLLLEDLRGARLVEGEPILTVVFMLAATGAYHLVYLLVFTAQGQAGSWAAAATEVILPTAFLNVVLVLPIYGLLWAASGGRRRRAAYA